MSAAGPLEQERRVGRRVIRAGDVVMIEGYGRARVPVNGRLVPGFRVIGFCGDEVTVFGARTATKAPGVRTFLVEAIGRRPRAARS